MNSDDQQDDTGVTIRFFVRLLIVLLASIFVGSILAQLLL